MSNPLLYFGLVCVLVGVSVAQTPSPPAVPAVSPTALPGEPKVQGAGVPEAGEGDNSSIAITEEVTESIPPVSVETVLRYAGLDDETLNLIGASEKQRQLIRESVTNFIATHRPQLLTYRAIWAEMLERYNNLHASAKVNAFDPCQFITDKAIRDAYFALADARQRFITYCGKSHESLDSVVSAEHLALIVSASQQIDLPSPFRWVMLSQAERKAIKRLTRVHAARMKLIERYPQLKARFDPNALRRQVQEVLSPDAFAQYQKIDAARTHLRPSASADSQEAH